MDMRVRISRCVVEAIQRAAAEAEPREACGLLFGTDGIEAMEVATNVSDDPERSFEIDPRSLLSALKAERAGGQRLAGYWHSHPSGDTTPSATDAAMAAPDRKLWLIVAGGEARMWRAGGQGAVHERFDPVELDQTNGNAGPERASPTEGT
jgi:proteasome lid subunit RPN8/RPN11